MKLCSFLLHCFLFLSPSTAFSQDPIPLPDESWVLGAYCNPPQFIFGGKCSHLWSFWTDSFMVQNLVVVSWHFKDNVPSSLASVSLLAAFPGSFRLTLEVWFSFACRTLCLYCFDLTHFGAFFLGLCILWGLQFDAFHSYLIHSSFSELWTFLSSPNSLPFFLFSF